MCLLHMRSCRALGESAREGTARAICRSGAGPAEGHQRLRLRVVVEVRRGHRRVLEVVLIAAVGRRRVARSLARDLGG
eukprot:10563576-Alexandrium_andersonii.AAC.1